MAKAVKDLSEGKKPFETQILEEWRLFYNFLQEQIKVRTYLVIHHLFLSNLRTTTKVSI